MHTCRPLLPDDAEAYVALRREMLAEAPWAFSASVETDRGCDEERMRIALAGAVGGGGGGAESAIIGAMECAGRKLLAAAGVVREERVKRRHIAMIWGVYVTPAARGRGLGRMVVAGAIEAARAWRGVESVQLCVSENAPEARRLYESLGFTAWGVEPDALRVNGKRYSETHMQRCVESAAAG